MELEYYGDRPIRQDLELTVPKSVQATVLRKFRVAINVCRASLDQLEYQRSQLDPQELRQLQSELSQVIKRLDTLPRDLAEKNQYITLLLEQRDQMRLKITELRARIQKLRKILGIKPKS